MYLPFAQKIKYSNDVLMERALPTPGYINAKKGQSIEPFTKLALTKVSSEKIELDAKFTPSTTKQLPAFFYSGEKVGRLGFDSFTAPFSGYLQQETAGYVFVREPHDYWLLSGLWGEIVGMVDTKSVLVKSQTIDIGLSACTQSTCSGELVVFPNPSTLLSSHYMEKFSKEVFGTIIYVGNYVSYELVERAIQMGVSGLIAGSADRRSFNLAKINNVFLGTFMGFGQIPTPNNIYEILKGVSHRYVFLDGDKNLFRIPNPEKFTPAQLKEIGKPTLLKYIQKGVRVVVLEKPFFGYSGLVEKISDSSIVVRLEENDTVVDVTANNLLAI